MSTILKLDLKKVKPSWCHSGNLFIKKNSVFLDKKLKTLASVILSNVKTMSIN